MSDDPIEFLRTLGKAGLKSTDRAVALIWLHSRSDPSLGLSANEIGRLSHDAGFAKQNLPRLKAALSKDRRTANGSRDEFRIRVNVRHQLDDDFNEFVGTRTIPVTHSVLPVDLFTGTRGYIEKVVAQINGSYDCGFYDSTAVMCRRLLETLIIEAFEAKGVENELKGTDGNFLMFSGLLAVVESSNQISLGRNALAGLRDFKRLGDLSAHSRKFNARKNDVTRIRDGIRVASEELLHIAGLA